jgi:hypothetical protein
MLEQAAVVSGLSAIPVAGPLLSRSVKAVPRAAKARGGLAVKKR